MRIYDIETLPFGCQVSIKQTDGKMTNGVAIVNAIAFRDCKIIAFEDIPSDSEIHLGWQ